ncbi:MAG: hypothetical protein P8182_15445 [Deltaproteobacteria bacterium]
MAAFRGPLPDLLMKKVLTFVGLVVLLFLAAYGVVRLAADALSAKHGEKAVEMTDSFLTGVISGLGKKFRQDLTNTPDKKLEKDAELMGRKFYPMSKGFMKGQLNSLLADPNRQEMSELMYQAGKDLSKNVVKPFSRGLAAGSTGVLEDVGKALEGGAKLGQEQKDLVETIFKALHGIQKALGENAREMPSQPRRIPRPVFPPPPAGPPLPPRQYPENPAR